MRRFRLSACLLATAACSCRIINMETPFVTPSFTDLTREEKLALSAPFYKAINARPGWLHSASCDLNVSGFRESVDDRSMDELYGATHGAIMAALDLWQFVKRADYKTRHSDLYAFYRRRIKGIFDTIPKAELHLVRFKRWFWSKWTEEERQQVLRMDRERAAKKREVRYRMTPEEKKLADEYERMKAKAEDAEGKAPDVATEAP